MDNYKNMGNIGDTGSIGKDWDKLLQDETKKDYFSHLKAFLKEEYREKTIYPERNKIFEAFKLTPYKEVKIVIIGQDPYHGENQAHGLAFSVQKGIKTPPSLLNIFKEISQDLGCSIPNNGDLSPWARQGVLLLNSSLTVVKGAANSHSKIGWEIFTDKVIDLLNERTRPLVFLLCGNYAKVKKKLITNKWHLLLEGAHPSPLSAHRGFFGCKHFSKSNDFLRKQGFEEIDWQLPNE